MKLTIGEKIALLRKEKNITQTELAEYLFLAPQTVSRWESGTGAPEISSLPRIAAFFGVSIDDLFGLTNLERAEDLVCKYSVLRDDRSFQEAMECVNSQLQTIDAFCANAPEDAAGLAQEREQLEAEKLHLWLQQGREAFERAYRIADSFVKKTEGDPAHRWYLPMRLQKNQLSAVTGRGREALETCRRDFAEAPSVNTLHLYFALLSDLHRYEEILSLQEREGPVRAVTLPPSRDNLDLWLLLTGAAAGTGGTELMETYMPSILELCDEQYEFHFLMILLHFYREENQPEKLPAIKKRLLDLLPSQSYNQYFEERARQQIEEG